jgi:hypothetical protein
MMNDGFDVLITFDKNMQFQQNFNRYSIPVIVLKAEDNTYLTLLELIPKIHEILKSNLKPGVQLIE